jgi:sortase A
MPGRRILRHAATALGVLLAGAGLWQIGAAGTIHAKAWLAQVLLTRAWETTLAGATAVRPWPWADTYPLARLQAPALGVDRIVLAGASGRTLAFGPGHLDGTAAPGRAGHTVLSGHRDTHFRFLEDLAPGSELRLQRPDGGWQSYRVVETRVIDTRRARLAPGDGRPALTLVTCYPFDAVVPGGPLRYLVFAEGASAAAGGAPREDLALASLPAGRTER